MLPREVDVLENDIEQIRQSTFVAAENLFCFSETSRMCKSVENKAKAFEARYDTPVS